MQTILSGKDSGFTLVEVAVVLVIVGVILGVANTNFRNVAESERLDRSRQILQQTREALFGFARGNHRLPCPDSGSDGIEDCGGGLSVGNVPFLTMGLDNQERDAKSILLQYSVYRNPAVPDADLAVLINRGDAVGAPAGSLDRRDFCSALSNASSKPPANTLTSTSTEITATGCTAATFINQAFVLASAGLVDADGAGGLFDNDNASGTSPCFASPEEPISASYDDLVNAVGLNDLSGQLCH